MYMERLQNIPKKDLTDHLRTVSRDGHDDHDEDVPMTWYRLAKSFEDMTPKFNQFDVCHHGHKIFGVEDHGVCDICNERKHPKCRRHIFSHYPIRDRLVRIRNQN